MFLHLCLPSWGKNECQPSRAVWTMKGHLVYSLPEAQCTKSVCFCSVAYSQFHTFITEREISKWGGSLDRHLAMATLIWTLAQAFTSYLRWGATKLDETELFRCHLDLHGKPHFHLSVILLHIPIASPVPHHHAVDSFTHSPAFGSHICRSPALLYL